MLRMVYEKEVILNIHHRIEMYEQEQLFKQQHSRRLKRHASSNFQLLSRPSRLMSAWPQSSIV